MQDYNRYLSKQSQKYKNLNNKDELFEQFIPILENLVMLHRGKRFTHILPENVRNTYINMMNTDEFIGK